MFERIIYDNMFGYFTANHLISPHETVFFLFCDSSINQDLSITYKMDQPFDNGFEVRGVFLYLFKVLEKVRHNGLIFKLHQYSISGNLL